MFKAKRTTLKVSAARAHPVTVAAVSLLLSRSDDQLVYIVSCARGASIRRRRSTSAGLARFRVLAVDRPLGRCGSLNRFDLPHRTASHLSASR